MRKFQRRAAAPSGLLLLALLLPGCQGQPIMGDISLGGFGIGAPYEGDGGFASPFASLPGIGWGGGWGDGGWGDGGWGGEGEHGWGGGWGEDH